MKKIYICHEGHEESHFEAIYKAGDLHGYEIGEYITLTGSIKRLIKGILREKKVLSSIINCVCELKKRCLLFSLRDEILIVGLAPYDYALNFYRLLFKRNCSIYFTSYPSWDERIKPPRGSARNRDKFESLLKECFQGVACVSKETQKQMKRVFKTTEVVAHSIETVKYSRKIVEQRTGKVLCLGQLIERKNIQLLLDWFKLHPRIQIDFAGTGVLQSKVEQYSREFENIFYLGRLSKAEIQNCLKEYDFLMLPSKAEPFGIVLIEALAAGVPCLVSNVSGPVEIIEDGKNGFIFDVTDDVAVESFGEVMNRLLQLSDDEYKEMSRCALHSSKRYDVSVAMERWNTIITKCERSYKEN